MSKNKPTIAQLKIACRHINELEKARMTENLAIRLLELVADMYAKTRTGGTPSVHHVRQIPIEQWSLAALRAKKNNPNAKAGTYLRVEHGTPRRDFARMVRNLYRRRHLNERTMANLIKKYWKLAVITHEEDRRLTRRRFKTPQQRWASARIRFRKGSPYALK
jgi:hypothetical protein